MGCLFVQKILLPDRTRDGREGSNGTRNGPQQVEDSGRNSRLNPQLDLSIFALPFSRRFVLDFREYWHTSSISIRTEKNREK